MGEAQTPKKTFEKTLRGTAGHEPATVAPGEGESDRSWVPGNISGIYTTLTKYVKNGCSFMVSFITFLLRHNFG